MAFAHRVVEADLLARLDVAHGDEGALPAEAGVGIARMIEILGRLGRPARREKEALLDLNEIAAQLLVVAVDLLDRDDPPAPHGDHLTAADRLAGIDTH